jgi:monofunctional biosynthetic peptidoglycan transglycosylase
MMSKEKALHYIGLPYRYFKIICFWIGFTVLTLFLTITFFIFIFFHNLPDVKHTEFSELKAIAQKHINKKYENRKRRHVWTSIKNINRDLLFTIIMAEDALFFKHQGFNYDAMINALFENVKADEIKYGASTISQQVVKNLYLSSEKSVVRKIKEYFITKRLEKYLTKNQILELYLNMAEFGPDIFGVYHASKTYFKKKPKEINAAEGAFMALFLPSPRRYHHSLFQNHNFSKQLRRKYRRIIKDIRFKDMISAKQYYAYLRYPFFKKNKTAKGVH